MTNLVEIFFDAASKYPDHKAIIHKDHSITYDQLQEQVKSTACYLKKKGIHKGDKVLVFIPMSIKLYQTVLALFSIGAVVVFVDEWSNLDRLKEAIGIVEVDAVIAPKKYLWISYLLRAFRSIKLKIAVPAKIEKADFVIEKMSPQETALVTFTTGSTGLPKAAKRTHGFLNEQFRILKSEIAARPSDFCLVTLPIVLLSILGSGATGIIADFKQKKPGQLDIDKQKRIIGDNVVSLIIASPFYLEKLVSLQYSNLTVRKVITGGAPVFPDLAKKISAAFKRAECIVAYGSTEAEPISTIAMEEVDVNQHGLKVGQVHPEVQCKIIKITDQSVLVEKGNWDQLEADFGEIVVAGPHVLKEYYNSEDAFKLNKIVDGYQIWHRTGDSGRLVDGQLYLNGRCSQLIKTENGYQSLFFIEYQLQQIQGVEIGTFVDGILFIELGPEGNRKEVAESIKHLSLGEKKMEFLRNMPRDKRHFSKIDYVRLKKS
jgi:acyl-CoA synthetase (AMP-forming)/AMP-acid ligase II